MNKWERKREADRKKLLDKETRLTVEMTKLLRGEFPGSRESRERICNAVKALVR